MEGQCVRRQSERVGNLTRRHPLGPGFDKEPEHVKSADLRERGERGYGFYFFHNSTNIELLIIGPFAFTHKAPESEVTLGDEKIQCPACEVNPRLRRDARIAWLGARPELRKSGEAPIRT
jgi:hypothetical protein